MRIIHVSGSPGSGKTTLGDLVGSSLTNFEIFDTDDLISDEEGEDLIELRHEGKHEEAKEMWKSMFTANIMKACDRSSDILFTGILNHFSPDGSILEFPIASAEKYFIDPPRTQLLIQFYGRYTTELKHDADFWRRVANKELVIPNSLEYLQANEREKAWHVENGYFCGSYDMIRSKIHAPCTVCFP